MIAAHSPVDINYMVSNSLLSQCILYRQSSLRTFCSVTVPLLKAFTFSFGEVMKNSLLPTLHTYLQHDENMGLKLLLCKHCL